jgi:hypothetical protein
MPAFQFNSQGVEPEYGGAGGLPLGKHPVVIAGTELKPTKDNTGGYLELTLEAIDGPAKGMQTKDRLNLHNKSDVAVRIANQQLSAYCHVTGVFAFNATEELHGKPFVVEMVARKDNPNQTEVGKLYDMNGNEPGKAGSGAATTGGGGFGNAQPAATGADQGGGQPGWAGGTGGGAGTGGGGAAATGTGAWNQGAGGGNAGPWGQK